MRLQKILVNCYSHRSDRNDVMHPSIGAALKKISNSGINAVSISIEAKYLTMMPIICVEEERNILLIYLQSTRKAWKLVRNQLINFPREFLMHTISSINVFSNHVQSCCDWYR